MDGMNNGFQQDYQNFQPDYQNFQQMPQAPSTNGKQVTGMILGIVSLVDAISAFFTSLIMMIGAGAVNAVAKEYKANGGVYINTTGTNVNSLVSSSVTGLILAIVAVALAIVVFVLYGQVQANGDVTKKIRVGKGLATAGCIVGGIALLFGIIATANASAAVSTLKSLSIF